MARISKIRSIDLSGIPDFRSTPLFETAEIYRQFLRNRFITGADWIPSKKADGKTMRVTDTLMNSITIKNVGGITSVGWHRGIQHPTGISANRLAGIHQFGEGVPVRQVLVPPDAATNARMKRATETVIGRIIERDKK